ncbi:MAG: substrate-binding domain-containing protein [Chloroflexi bacterium]|nr:substrate-binding domain-containing protein [Chloroflexota bacterium]
MPKAGALIGGAITLAACVRSTPQATPPLPTPFPEIATTPELEAWTTTRILSFRGAKEVETFIGLGLQVQALPAALESAEAQDLTLVISSTEPPAGWFATPLGKEPIAVVVNTHNPVRDLTPDEVIGIFIGRTDNWQALGGPDLPIQPVIPLEGAETRSHLQRTLLGDRQFTSSALLGPSPEAVLALIQEDLGAIGILPLSAISAEVGLLSLDGHDPMQEEEYPWLMEVLGMAPVEPGGVVREWLAWLQAAGLREF